MSASVEIVFDNADSRFPVDKEEVWLEPWNARTLSSHIFPLSVSFGLACCSRILALVFKLGLSEANDRAEEG